MHKWLHVSDLHLTEGPRLEDESSTLNRIVEKGVSEDVSMWLVTGDLYGHAVPHRSTPKERLAFIPALLRMADQAPVILVQGNHDHPEDFELFHELHSEHKIYAVTAAEHIEVETHSGVVDVFAMAYPTKGWLLRGAVQPAGVERLSVERTNQMVQDRLAMLFKAWGARVRGDRPSVFAGHVMVRGSETGSGVVLSGKEIEFTPHQLGQLDVTYGALGHMHHRQEPLPGWWYPGSPWSTAHGSSKEERFVHLVTEGQVLACNTGARRFVTVDAYWEDGRWTNFKGEPWNDKALEQHGVEDAEVRIRLRYREEQMDTATCSEFVKQVWSWAPMRVKVESQVTPSSKTRAPEVVDASSVGELLNLWCSLQDPEPTTQVRERMHELAGSAS